MGKRNKKGRGSAVVDIDKDIKVSKGLDNENVLKKDTKSQEDIDEKLSRIMKQYDDIKDRLNAPEKPEKIESKDDERLKKHLVDLDEEPSHVGGIVLGIVLVGAVIAGLVAFGRTGLKGCKVVRNIRFL